MISRRTLALIPLIFWSILVAIRLIRIIPLVAADQLMSSLYTLFITTAMDVVSFCFFYYLIFPKLPGKRRISLNISVAILFWLLYSFVWVWVYKLTGRIEDFNGSQIVYRSSLGHTLLSLLYAVVLRLSVDWFHKYQQQMELEKQQRITELALLRSQINPHFLFNTLNNINSFSSHDPEKTSYAIIKLSDIMRYMLYEANGEKVLLDKEIDYISNFIDLQKLRYKERDFVQFKIKGETANLFIPPMIFLPFIENAFKHGTISVSNAIEISLDIRENTIIFSCKNQIRELNETEKQQVGGLGMKNIRRRLDLLFPSRYHLNISKDKNVYIVELTIQLDEH